MTRFGKIEDNGGRVIYTVWKDDCRIAEDMGYDESIRFAKENNADEVEAVIWYDEEDYNNYKPADKFVSIWRRR